jgi:predicted phage terminase large subunit-like protein
MASPPCEGGQRAVTLGPAQRAQLVESVLEGRASPNTDATLAKDATGPGSLAAFVQQFWPLLEPGNPLEWNWHLDLICRELEKVARGETRDLVICVPPGFAKSLLVSVLWPAWWWLHEPHKRFLTVASVEGLAIRDNGRMRTVVESEWYRRLVLYMEEEHGIKAWDLSHDHNRARDFENDPHKGLRQCFGIVGGVTGHRGDGLIIDDPHQVNDVLGDPSAVQEKMDQAWHRVNVVLGDRVISRKRAWRVVIMQRLHEQDVAGRILAQGKCTHIVLPMRFDPDHPYKHPEDPRREAGELLSPQIADEPEVVEGEQKLDVVPGQKEAQYGQRPIRAGGLLYKLAWMLRRYDWDPQRPDTRMDRILGTVDTTFKSTRTSAYVSIQVWGIQGTKRYLLDEVYARLDYVECRQVMRDLYEKWHMSLFLVEEKANGPALIRELQDEIPCVVGFNPDGYGDKYLRAQLVAPVWMAGNVLLPEPQWLPTVGDFVAHLCGFPGIGKDRMDSMSQLFLFLAEESRASNDSNLIEFMQGMVAAAAEGWEG